MEIRSRCSYGKLSKIGAARNIRMVLGAVLACFMLLPSNVAAEGVEWVFDDSKRNGEVKHTCSYTASNGIETFGFAWEVSNELLRFRTVPAYMKIIIR